MRPIRTVAVLPTMFTLGNLVCGFFAVVVAARIDAPTQPMLDLADAHNVMLSAWLIFLGMVFDALDGYVARLSRSASEFGKELDSLCDVVTFGVAPAFLLVKMCPKFTLVHREAAWVIAASYAACAALRLARFNVETGEDDDHLHFRGLPSPAAAASVAGFAIMFYTLRSTQGPGLVTPPMVNVLQTVLPFFALAVALLMVSRVPYPHIVNQVFRGQRSFGHVVALVFAFTTVMVVRGFSVPILCVTFVLYGPIRLAWRKVVERRQQPDSLF
jgi:CDP-diacylglycerol--serine O-phosphatidyltransferase